MDAYDNSEPDQCRKSDKNDISSDKEDENESDIVPNDSNMKLKISCEDDSSATPSRQPSEVDSPKTSVAPHNSMTRIETNDSNSAQTSSTLGNMRNYESVSLHAQENCHSQDSSNLLSSKNSSIYDFNDSNSASGEDSNSELQLDDVPLSDANSERRVRNDSSLDNNSGDTKEANNPLPHSVSEYSSHNDNSQSKGTAGSLPHMNNHHNFGSDQNNDLAHSVQQTLQEMNQSSGTQNSILPRLNSSSNQTMSSTSMDVGGQSYNSNNGAYDDSLSLVPNFPSTGGGNCYDGINIIRRARGRPKGSKNGTGMGRARGRALKFSRLSTDGSRSPCQNYDLRNIADPFSCQRRGRPRSRFIVDLGEQNHEAWTKAKEELNISDAELTTLLLSL